VSGLRCTSDPLGIVGHAWEEAWLGSGQGWLSLDVTGAATAGGRACRFAVGRDGLDASPQRGVHAGGGHSSVRVTEQLVHDGPLAQG
jgi:transglutaminase-like putative cysteine protease